MDIRWHRRKSEFNPAVTVWYAVKGPSGPVLAEAVNTSQTGTEDYPWDWSFTDEGYEMALQMYPATTTQENRTVKSGGVEDSLRSVKDYVAYALSPR